MFNIDILNKLNDNEIKIDLDNSTILCNSKCALNFYCNIENNIIEVKQLKKCNNIISYNIYGSSINASLNIIALSDIILTINDINLKTELDNNESDNNSININNDNFTTKLYINGDNIINSNYNYAISCSGTLELYGNGNLNIQNKLFGINSSKLIINENCKLNINLFDINDEAYGNAIDSNDIIINSGNINITTNNLFGIECDNLYVNNNCDIKILSNENNCISATNSIILNNGNITLYSINICAINCVHLCCNNCNLLYTTNNLSFLPMTQTSQCALLGMNINSGQNIKFINNENNDIIAEYNVPYKYIGNNRIIFINPLIESSTNYIQQIGLNTKYSLTSYDLKKMQN